MNNELYTKIVYKQSDAGLAVLSKTVYKKDIHKNGKIIKEFNLSLRWC